jgi:hypothetical protein
MPIRPASASGERSAKHCTANDQAVPSFFSTQENANTEADEREVRGGDELREGGCDTRF